VRNYGKVIPIAINKGLAVKKGLKVYNPQMIFGMLLTSSNYNFGKEEVEVRIGCGRNGYGAKLTNIFSKWFEVECSDGVHNYKQTWTNNMNERTEPEITESEDGSTYTQISWLLDFERFGYKKNQYEQSELELFARICVDCAHAVDIPLYLNGNLIYFEHFSDYATLYFPKVKSSAEFNFPFVQSGKNCYIKFLLFDSTETGRVISFANGIMTKYGGTHLEPIKKKISKEVVDLICPEKKKGKARPINVNDVFRHLSMILIAKVVNPEFSGQTKGELTKPEIKLKLPNLGLSNIIIGWELIQRLKAEILAKDYRNFNKQTKKKGRKDIEKLRDANFAFSKDPDERMQARLWVTEGDSASSLTKHVESQYPDSGNYVGSLPMRGKPTNAVSCKSIIANDKEKLNHLAEALGLVHGVVYDNIDAIQTLRYGGLIIVADADDDGKHIIGLIAAFFYQYFKELLQYGYVVIFRSPIYRLSKGGKELGILSDYEYDLWKEENVDWEKWHHDYFKGLASSNDEQIASDLANPKYSQFAWDDLAHDSMQMAFGKKNSNRRKKWLTEWNSTYGVESMEELSISDFVQYELGVYSKTNVRRSIPKLIDGLKPSQRKIVYGCMRVSKWSGFFGRKKKTKFDGVEQDGEEEEDQKSKKGKKGKNGVGKKKDVLHKSNAEKIKLDSLVSKIGDTTHYHHGAQSLFKALVWMSQEFVGSNNLPYFVRESQMGTRDAGGKDCGGPRYCSTSPQWWLNYVFRKEDDLILEYEIEEGKQAEPKYMLPIVPMQLINGSNGIGTGWSTFIPCHHPVSVIDRLIDRMENGLFEEIRPWYKGFKGEIHLLPKNKADGKISKCIPTVDSDQNATREDDESEEPREDDDESEDEQVDKTLDDTPLNDAHFDDASSIKVGKSLYDAYGESIPASMVTLGEFETAGNRGRDITVTELPIGVWTDNYETWLKKCTADGRIRGYDRFPQKGGEVKLVIQNKSLSLDHKGLGLQMSYGLTNMVCLDLDSKPIRYETTLDILEDFYNTRLMFYERRKEAMILVYEKNIEDLSVLLRFLNAINDKKLIINKHRHENEVKEDMIAMGFPTKLLSKTHIHRLTLNRIKEVEAQIVNVKAELEQYKLKTSEGIWYEELMTFRQALIDNGYSK
jgi:DNA topoisomerase-2